MGGTSGGTGGTASGGIGGTGGTGGSMVPIEGCLADWRDNTECAPICLDAGRPEWEEGCQRVLDCYGVNDCDESSCGSGEGVCGNRLTVDSATRDVAGAAYDCLCF